ncbi:MAG: peptidoglycan -binding protein [Tistlia sp.]|uniref:peptidoglycan -binding protein n=1 Tax=Tistlia sp. TaxID=3057121 RepID=UPI0034A50A6C
MYTLGRSSRNRSVNIWPGFVDGLSTLLMVVIFVLMVFMVAQYFLSVALTGRDQQLSKLGRELQEASQLLILERDANADLRISIAQLSSELQISQETRDELQSELRALTDRRAQLSDELSATTRARDSLAEQLAALRARSEGREDQLAAALETGDALRTQLQQARSVTEEQARDLREAYATIEADRETIEARLGELATLQELRDQLRGQLQEARAVNEQQAEELRQVYATVEADRETIEAQLAELATLRELREELDGELQRRERALAALAERSEELEQDLDSSVAERRELADQLRIIEERLTESQDFALDQQALSEEARREIRLLNSQLASLRRRLSDLTGLLEASEAENEAKEVQILDLGQRLNAALATKVQELARYRSEFFGRLREILGDNPNIRIVGDRFVFQAEVLFPSGSATLEPEGREQIAQLGELLRDVAARIPSDIDWVLRVDGHTDDRPISTFLFPSNWELSAARAIEVVKVLIDEGIPPNRLAAAGFGEYQPIETGRSAEALLRNRRIEFKLTER